MVIKEYRQGIRHSEVEQYTELTEQLVVLRLKIETALECYALGKNPFEIKKNRSMLKIVNEVVSKLLADHDFYEKTIHRENQPIIDSFIARVDNVIRSFEVQTREKVMELGFDSLETYEVYFQAIKQGDFDQVRHLAVEADRNLLHQLPSWTFEVVHDWEENKDTLERRKMHQEIIDELIEEAKKQQSIFKDKRKVLVFHSGLPGSGKSTSTSHSDLAYRHMVDADVDTIRTRLFNKLKASGNPLFSTDGYNAGEYDDNDQAIIQALNPECNYIYAELVKQSIQQGVSVLCQGTLRSEVSVHEMIKFARQNGYFIEVNHTLIQLDQCVQQLINRPRSFPIGKKLVSATQTYSTFVRLFSDPEVMPDYATMFEVQYGDSVVEIKNRLETLRIPGKGLEYLKGDKAYLESLEEKDISR